MSIIRTNTRIVAVCFSTKVFHFGMFRNLRAVRKIFHLHLEKRYAITVKVNVCVWVFFKSFSFCVPMLFAICCCCFCCCLCLILSSVQCVDCYSVSRVNGKVREWMPAAGENTRRRRREWHWADEKNFIGTLYIAYILVYYLKKKRELISVDTTTSKHTSNFTKFISDISSPTTLQPANDNLH